MVTAALLAAALLCWPARPLWRDSRPPGRRIGGQHQSTGPHRAAVSLSRWSAGAGAVSVCATALWSAGVAGGIAAGAAWWTGRVLVRQHLSARRRRQGLTDILAAVRTLARELHAGAEPAVAVNSGQAAAKGNGAAVLRALAQEMQASDLRTGDGAPARSIVGGPGRRAGPTVSPARRGVGPLAADSPVLPTGRPGTGDTRSGAGASGSPAGHALLRLRVGWLLSRRCGVAYSPLIDGLAAELSDAMAGDSRRAGEVAGPRMSGYVMAGLPVMGLLLGVGMGADPFGVLLNTAVGRVLLVVGVLLTCAGLLWSARIVAP